MNQDIIIKRPKGRPKTPQTELKELKRMIPLLDAEEVKKVTQYIQSLILSKDQN